MTGSWRPGVPAPDLGLAGQPARVARPGASRLPAALAALATAGGCIYLATVDPNTSSAYPQCPLKILTGLDCAGCGGLRAAHSLLQGDLLGAADQNLLVVLALPVVAYLVARVLLARRGRRLPLPRYHPAFVVAAVATMVGYSIVRNLAWGPGPWLQSGFA